MESSCTGTIATHQNQDELDLPHTQFKLLPEAQATLDASDHPIVMSMSNQELFKEEILETLKKLGEGGRGLAYRVGDFCLKVCRSTDDPSKVFTQTEAEMISNKKYRKWGNNEVTKLLDCQHPYVVQVYAMVFTDKGNIAILMELAQSDFVSFYDDVIEQHKPPAFGNGQKEEMKERLPEA